MKSPPQRRLGWGLTVQADLGGRLNWHWQVTTQGDRAVLRRWHGSEPEVHSELAVLGQGAGLACAVPSLLREPVWEAGAWWSVHAWVPGEPAVREHARQRDQWLAGVHAAFRARPGRKGDLILRC